MSRRNVNQTAAGDKETEDQYEGDHNLTDEAKRNETGPYPGQESPRVVEK